MTTRHRPSRFADVAPARGTLRVGLCVALCVLAFGMAGRGLVPSETAQVPVAYVIPIDGVIDLGLAPFVERTLTEAGIDSLSLNADPRLETMLAVLGMEMRIAQEEETAGIGTQGSR